MIDGPWNLILTILFVSTAAVCAFDILVRLRHPRTGPRPEGDVFVDVNHILMSAAMIWMSWSMESELALWLQVALFAGLTIGLALLLPRAVTTMQRLDLGGHIALNAAMIWMLAAMPLLMAEMSTEHAGSMDPGMDTTMGDGGHLTQLTETPIWAGTVNIGFILLSAAIALWWSHRARTMKRHRLHASCHAAMGAGMAAMLILMN